jgi:hypothetical protein
LAIITLTKVPQDVEMSVRDRLERNVWLTKVDAVLLEYFIERERAGREGLLEWERNYIVGRIADLTQDENQPTRMLI